MKIAIITSRTARELVESYIKSNIVMENVEVKVYSIRAHSISMLPAEVIAKMVEGDKSLSEKLGEHDIILVPGSVPGNTNVISKVIGKPVYKASKALALLPQVLKHITGGGLLDTIINAENVISLPSPPIDYVEAFKLNGISIPLRGPPIVLAAEIPYRVRGEEFKKVLGRYAREGAQLIVIGASFDTSPEVLGEKVTLTIDLGYPVIAEAPSREHARIALDSGASGLIISADSITQVLGYLGSDKILIVGDRNIDSLESAVSRAREAGVWKIVVDPVVGIPLLDFSSTFERYKAALKLNLPMIFSSANVTEEIEADSHGIHAVLAVLALELGASIYHVVEDSYKTLHSVSEAREAIRLAVEAYSRKESMKGYYSKLLVLKQSNPPEGASIGVGERVDYIEPRWDKRGYARIEVDHGRGVIVVAYISYKGDIVKVEGVHGPSLARAIIRRAGLDTEHAAYLGYEIAKAEIALKLGKTYVQDEELIQTPWGAICEKGCS